MQHLNSEYSVGEWYQLYVRGQNTVMYCLSPVLHCSLWLFLSLHKISPLSLLTKWSTISTDQQRCHFKCQYERFLHLDPTGTLGGFILTWMFVSSMDNMSVLSLLRLISLRKMHKILKFRCLWPCYSRVATRFTVYCCSSSTHIFLWSAETIIDKLRIKGLIVEMWSSCCTSSNNESNCSWLFCF